jgi:hypothetical protein
LFESFETPKELKMKKKFEEALKGKEMLAQAYGEFGD